MVYKLLDKNIESPVIRKMTADVTVVLVEELYKIVIKNFKRRK